MAYAVKVTGNDRAEVLVLAGAAIAKALEEDPYAADAAETKASGLAALKVMLDLLDDPLDPDGDVLIEAQVAGMVARANWSDENLEVQTGEVVQCGVSVATKLIAKVAEEPAALALSEGAAG